MPNPETPNASILTEPCAAVIARRLRDAAEAEDERAAYAANARENDYESLPRNCCTKKGR